jgi:hypothetical protein
MQALGGALAAPLGGGTGCGAGAGAAAFASPEEEFEYYAFRYKVDPCSLRIPHDW